MEQQVYTTYWQNRLSNVKKEHGSYENEEEAIKGIKAWWELHKEAYPHAEYKRTNSGALEIIYNGDNHFYRIEKRSIEGKLPSRKYKLLWESIHYLNCPHHQTPLRKTLLLKVNKLLDIRKKRKSRKQFLSETQWKNGSGGSSEKSLQILR